MKLLSLCLFTCLLSLSPRFAYGESFEGLDVYLASARSPDSLTLDQLDGAQQALAQQFAAVCGDTFCDGDYESMTPVNLQCAVGVSSQEVTGCTWNILGLHTAVNPQNGRVSSSSHLFACELDFHGSVADLATYLRQVRGEGQNLADQPGLRAVAIPGSGKTLMETLTRCL